MPTFETSTIALLCAYDILPPGTLYIHASDSTRFTVANLVHSNLYYYMHLPCHKHNACMYACTYPSRVSSDLSPTTVLYRGSHGLFSVMIITIAFREIYAN